MNIGVYADRLYIYYTAVGKSNSITNIVFN